MDNCVFIKCIFVYIYIYMLTVVGIVNGFDINGESLDNDLQQLGIIMTVWGWLDTL